jgi:hypothetical protein
MMKRNMTSVAIDRGTARPVFRSFLDGIVLLAVIAILLTVQVTPVDNVAATEPEVDARPVRASLFPSIISLAGPMPAAELEEAPVEMEILRNDDECLVIMVRRGSGDSAEIIPAVLRPEV